MWANTGGWFGRRPSVIVDHWLMRHLVDMLQYRLPVHTRLGNGMKIKVHAHDYVGGQIIRQGYYEPEIVRLFERILKPGMVFLDVGAHVGQYTLVASRLVGAKGAVHSFEPDPETYRWLTSNIQRNALTNVVANRIALAEKRGTLSFFLSNVRDIGSNSLRRPLNFSGRTCQVKCDTLDEYLHDRAVGGVGLLKIDVEGGEFAALNGGRCLFTATDRPAIIIEFEEERQKAFGYTCARLIELLVGFGYRLFRIGATIEQYAPRNPDLPSFNVLALPSNRSDLIDELTRPEH